MKGLFNKFPSPDAFYPAAFRKFRAKQVPTPEFIPFQDGPLHARMVKLNAKEQEGAHILRTALTMSCITGRPFSVENILPMSLGLRNTFLICTEISQAKVFGYKNDATSLAFYPHKLGPQERPVKQVNVDSEYCVSHVIPCLLPILWFVPEDKLSLFISGGTNNLDSVCADMVCATILPMLKVSQFSLEQDSPSPPVSGGMFLELDKKIDFTSPVSVLTRGRLVRKSYAVIHIKRVALANAVASALHQSVGQSAEVMDVQERAEANGPCVVVKLEFEHFTHVFSRYLDTGEDIESLVQTVVSEEDRYLTSPAPIDEAVACMLIVPLVCGGQGGEFVTSSITPEFVEIVSTLHTFLNGDCVEWTEVGPGQVRVKVHRITLANDAPVFVGEDEVRKIQPPQTSSLVIEPLEVMKKKKKTIPLRRRL